MGKLRDLTGMRFGKLAVITRAISYEKAVAWTCICDCGKETVARGHNLESGNTKSCGCLRTFGTNRPRTGQSEQAAFKELHRRYIHGAKVRNLAFDLTETEFASIVSQPCHYCGLSPSNSIRGNRFRGKQAKFRFNGIDRIDNSKGYLIDNCTAACKTCNFAKNSGTYSEFTAWLDRVKAHNRKGFDISKK